MKQRIGLASLMAIVALVAAEDLLACGDKFLVGSRGTRYQRPKNARAASIVIYASPSSDIAAVSGRVESLLNRQGHHATTVKTFEQLSAILSGGRFDVILAATDVAAKIQQLFSGSADAAVVVAFEAHPSPATLLTAIDKAVERHDLQRNKTRS
jgi:hypothetical protein